MRMVRPKGRWPMLLPVVLLLGGSPSRAAELPLSVRQLVMGANAFVGHTLIVEVLFNYIASMQDRPGWLRCSVEGKFRLTGDPADADVLYNVYLAPEASLVNSERLRAGAKLTMHCRIREAAGARSRIDVSLIEFGWGSEAASARPDSAAADSSGDRRP